MEGMMALSIPIVFVIIVGLTTKWISDNRVRRELTAANASPELVEKLLAAPAENAESSLKWGMVSVAVGLSLFGIQLLDLDEGDPLSFGLVFIFGGIGLLLFYMIKSRQNA